LMWHAEGEGTWHDGRCLETGVSKAKTTKISICTYPGWGVDALGRGQGKGVDVACGG
jgi:hypothetical protein